MAQVTLEATGEGSTAELARQAAISELSYQISAQVKSRSESRQQLKNDQFEESASQSVVIQSDLPLLGNRIEITPLPNTYRATARLESKAALPLYLTRIAELNQDLQSAKEDPLKWEIFSAIENLTNSGSACTAKEFLDFGDRSDSTSVAGHHGQTSSTKHPGSTTG